MSGVQSTLEFDTSAADAAVDAFDSRLSEVVSGFEQALVDAISSAMGTSVEVQADTSSVTSDIDEAVGSADPTVTVDADTSDAVADIEGLDAEAVVDVAADTSAAEADIADLDGVVVEGEVEIDTAGAEAQLDALSESGGAATEALGGVQDSATGASTAASGLGYSLGSSGTAGIAAATGYAAVAAAGYEIVSSFGEAQEVAAQTAVLIENTGGNANVTAEEIAALATQTQDYGVSSDEAAQQGANFVLAMSNVRNEAGEGNDIFTRTIELGADYTATVGGDVTSATQKFGRALNDPVRGMNLLRRSGIAFTEEQRAQVEALVATGDTLGAQRVLLDALEGRYKGAAEELSGNLGPSLVRVRENLDEVAEALGSLVAPGVVTLAEDLGEVASIAQDAAEGVGGLVEMATDGADGLGVFGEIAGRAFRNLNPIGLALNVRDAGEALAGLGGSSVEFTPRGEAAADALLAVQNATLAAATATLEASGALDTEAEATDRLAGNVSDLSADLDEMFGSQRSVADGALDIRNRQRDLVGSLADLRFGYNAGGEASDAFLATARELATGIRQQTLRVLESGEGADVARAQQNNYVDGLRAVLRQAGLTDGQIDRLIRTYARVPERRLTRFDTPGADNSRRSAEGVDRAVRSIPASKSSVIHVDNTRALYNIQEVIDAYDNLDRVRAANNAADARVKGPESAPVTVVSSDPVTESSTGAAGVRDVYVPVTIDARGASEPGRVAEAASVGVSEALFAAGLVAARRRTAR